MATIYGTFQSTLSNFRYLRKVWQKNQMEERLLGVSLTGIMDHPVMSGQAREGLVWDLNGYNERTLAEILTELKGIAEETNAEFADLLGIPRSKQITLVKVV